jgi:NADH-quinone oxidoreductase subunit J
MELVIFFITSIVAIIGAVAMLLSRNAVHSALFLLLNFSSIAVLFLLLRAPFLFAVQLIIYAGAIIVLFLFVVMLLGAERSEDERDQIAWQRPVAVVLGVLLLGEALYVFFAQPGTALRAPTAGAEDFASPDKISAALFSTYLLPFEITSVILLAALVGVVVLHQRDSATGAQGREALSEMSTVAPEPTQPVDTARH